MRIILLAAPIDTQGGGGRHLQNVMTALKDAEHNVEMLPYTGSFWSYVRAARAAAKRADIVQVVDMRDIAFAGFLATRFTRAKFVVVTQGTYAVAPLYSAKRGFFARHLYRVADAVTSGSRFTADEILKKVPGLPITLIDPGIDMKNFPSLGGKPHVETNPLLIGVGTVKARKGYDISLRAFAKLKESMPGARYVVVGPQTDEPGYVEKLKDLAVELGVQNDFEMRANIADEELNHLYDKASLFVLTSINEGFHFEGFGMVFLEAAAHGLPTVGTEGNGIADAMEDGKTGILVPQRDIAATAKAMKDILSDEDLYERMSARGVLFAREHDLPRLAEKYEKLYHSI